MNGRGNPPSAHWVDKTFGDAIDWAASINGDREGVVFRDERLSYAELGRRVRAFACGLAAIGIKPGDHVALWMADSIDWIIARWAIPYIGAVLVPINTRFRDSDIAYVLRQSDAKVLIVQDGFGAIDYFDILGTIAPDYRRQKRGAWSVEKLPELRMVIGKGAEIPGSMWRFEELGGHAANQANQDLVVEYRRSVSAGDVAQILYTSGTTSFPKGAMVCHGPLLQNNFNTIERFNMTPQDRYLSSVPLFSATGTSYTLSTLLCGCTMVIADHFDPAYFCSLVEKEKITFTFFVDAMVYDLMAYPDLAKRDLSTLRTGTGGPLSAESFRLIVEKFGAREFTNVYGMSETSNSICRSFWHEPLELRLRTNGRPVPGVHVDIVDVDSEADLPPGRVGEIRVSGYTVMKGYYKRPEENAKAFDEKGRLCTGDLGELTDDGYIIFRGRVKEMIKPGGFNVSTQEIEEFVRSCPGVKEAVVVGVPDARLGEVAFVYLQPKDGEHPTAADIIARCKAHIAGYKVPRFVEIVDEFPFTSTGKIKKLELKEKARLKIEAADRAASISGRD